MAVVELSAKDEIASFFRRNARAHAYELGDLDDFDWPYTRWFGWRSGDRLEQVALLYSQPAVPVLIAIAEEPTQSMVSLVRSLLDDLPTTLYVHATASLVDVLAERYDVTGAEPHLKLALESPDPLPAPVADVVRLGPGDRAEVEEFYRLAYPGTWFTSRMLATGRYVGIRRDGVLACVAGVHVFSPTWRVAALGNVATLPELRRHGLAQRACATLCHLLFDDGVETIALNVRVDNSAAIAAYERLGFERSATYTEASLVVRGNRPPSDVQRPT